ncbi:sodium-dependent transporter [Chlamydia suis]|uniref:sodium-dependent transporter n=1 Tax=Chlamydia suis TaxID=83559 RepID=UPI0009B1070E|nr:sodium-dependent transporter [Chlamydia suis]
MNKKNTVFSSRLGFILSMMGVAIGAGNIWRFPRMVAQNGGGGFILLWLLFLLIWSIPLIIVELSIGKLTRKAPIGALIRTAGPKAAWLGGFVVLVATCILGYYSNIVGWGFSYFFYALSGKILPGNNFSELWANHCQSWMPLSCHCLALFLAYCVIRKGVVNGIETCNKILIPLFFLCSLVLLARAVSLPNAWEGIRLLFVFNKESLSDYKVWIEALTQNAWDTGAGWGLLLVYAGFASKQTSLVTNGAITAITNNLISFLMAVIVFSACASLDSIEMLGLREGVGASNIGMAFIYLPELFTRLPHASLLSSFFSAIFFLAFSMAALSSMISMLFLLSQTLTEFGIKKHLAESFATVTAFLIGVPSALNLQFFDNQDTVWGIALILNGMIFIYAAVRYGIPSLRKEVINTVPGDYKLKAYFDILVKFLLPLEGIFLLAWYFYEGALLPQEYWWNPFRSYNISSLLMQWGLGGGVLFLLNRKLYTRFYLNN